jgi:hypothetical protein
MDNDQAVEPQDQLVLTLRKPISLGELQYAEITLTEPTVAQLRKAAKAGDAIDQLATLIHLNAAVPMTVVDRMVQRDLDAAGDFFGRFSGASPTTPGMSSLS